MRQEASISTRGRVLVIVLSVIAVVLLTAVVVSATVFLNHAPADTARIDVLSEGEPHIIEVLSVGEPHIVTEQQLRAFGAANGPIYWAGSRDGAQYELTYTTSGSVYIRYLPAEAEKGDPQGSYLTVASYSVVEGFSHLVEQSNVEGFTLAHSQNGADIVTEDADGTRAYFAFPDVPLQVEVFDPEEGKALELVSNGSVVLLQNGAS